MGVFLGLKPQAESYHPFGIKPFVFVDGAMTMYHNPAFQLFLMATTDVYHLGWELGVDRLLLISIGSGNSSKLGLRWPSAKSSPSISRNFIPDELRPRMDTKARE